MSPCLLPRCRSGQDAASDSRLCETCIGHLVSTLRTVEENVAALTPVKGVRPGMVATASGFESASPAADHVLVMLDPRSKITGPQRTLTGPDDDLEPPLSVAVLGEWAQLAGWTVGTVRDAVSALLVNHRWITDQDWVVDYADELYRLLGQLLRANGDGPPIPQAACIRPIGSVTVGRTTVPVLCNGPIVEVRYQTGGGARCLACDESYSGFQLVRLALGTSEAS